MTNHKSEDYKLTAVEYYLIEDKSQESFASSISLQQVQRLRIRDSRYRKTVCDIADPMDLLNTGGMEISNPYWEPLK